MERLLEVDDFAHLREVFGPQDKNLRVLEKELGVHMYLKPEGLLIKGDKTRVRTAQQMISKFMQLRKDGLVFNREEIGRYVSSGSQKTEDAYGIKVSSPRKSFILPKTQGQHDYIEAMRENDIVFSIGPAGTGKTYLAMATAVNCLLEKKVGRIILTRPAIEAGESLGFLPGDMYQKLGPYLRPLYDALYDMLAPELIEEYIETGVIEVVALAYMRGRTLNNAFVVLDEAQNCTTEQLRMFLTRLGFDSKTVITGDITQSDLPEGRPTGLLEAIKILKPIQDIKFVHLTKKDVVRHPLIQKIIQAYEDFYTAREGSST